MDRFDTQPLGDLFSAGQRLTYVAQLLFLHYDLILKPGTLHNLQYTGNDELKLATVSEMHAKLPREPLRFLSMAFSSLCKTGEWCSHPTLAGYS